MDPRTLRTESAAGSAGTITPRRRWLRRLLAAGAVALAIYVSSGWWLAAAGRWLDVSEVPRVSDYCLVLAGDFHSRPFGAAALWRKGYVRQGIWLTHIESNGPSPRTGLDSDGSARRILVTLGIPDDRIAVLDGACVSTFDEAQSLARELAKHPDATVAVVTSDYHTRRSRWVFRHVLGDRADQLQFISVPTDYAGADNWWTVEEVFASYSKEFLKLPFYWVRYGSGAVWILLAMMLIGVLWMLRRVRRQRLKHVYELGLGRSPLSNPSAAPVDAFSAVATNHLAAGPNRSSLERICPEGGGPV